MEPTVIEKRVLLSGHVSDISDLLIPDNTEDLDHIMSVLGETIGGVLSGNLRTILITERVPVQTLSTVERPLDRDTHRLLTEYDGFISYVVSSLQNTFYEELKSAAIGRQLIDLERSDQRLYFTEDMVSCVIALSINIFLRDT